MSRAMPLVTAKAAIPMPPFMRIGDGDPDNAIVFLHPGLGTMRSWGRFAPLLCAEQNRAGIAYTREEYEWRDGQCALPGDFVLRQAVRLEELLQAWGVERALMIGSSDGASIALAHAARHPARVQAIVSIAAHVLIDPQMPRALERIREETSSAPPQWLIDAHGAQGPMLAQAWCETWHKLMTADWTMTELLPAIRCPVLALQGENDENGLPVQLDVLKRYVPDCIAELLAGLGHFPFIEAPDAVVAAINEFCAGSRPSSLAVNTF
jgi:pimeloyl-ACP methyl ester carboxylesterase